MSSHKFIWRCSYQGCLWFDVYAASGELFSIELRHRLEQYERDSLNRAAYPTNADIDRMVTATIGYLIRESNPSKAIPSDIVHAFNEWRDTTWAASMEKMRSQPERYGITFDEPWFQRPAPVGAMQLCKPDGAEWMSGTSFWTITTPKPDTVQATIAASSALK